MGSKGLWSPKTFLYNTWYTLLSFVLVPRCPVDLHTPCHPRWGCSGNSHGLILSWGVYAQHGNFPFQSCSSVFLGLGCRAGVLGRCQQQLIYCPKELNTRRKIPQLSWPPVLWSNLPSVLCRFSFLLPAVLLWKPP